MFRVSFRGGPLLLSLGPLPRWGAPLEILWAGWGACSRGDAPDPLAAGPPAPAQAPSVLVPRASTPERRRIPLLSLPLAMWVQATALMLGLGALKSSPETGSKRPAAGSSLGLGAVVGPLDARGVQQPGEGW